MKEGSNTIPVLHKAIALVETVAASRTGSSVKNLSMSLRIPPATCYRLVRTLAQHNWLRENEHGEYQLGFGLAHIARSYAEIEHLLNLLEPSLRDLAELTGLSTKITIREGHHSLTALRSEPSRMNAITSPVGSRFHLAVGSAGAVLLNQMDAAEAERIILSAPDEVWKRQTPDDARQRMKDAQDKGIAWELGQQHASIYAASVPLKFSAGITAALSIVGWPEDFEEPRRPRLEKLLRTQAATCHDILKEAGHGPVTARKGKT